MLGQFVHRVTTGKIVLHQPDHPLDAPVQRSRAILGPWWRNQALQQIVTLRSVWAGAPKPRSGPPAPRLHGPDRTGMPFAVEHEVVDCVSELPAPPPGRWQGGRPGFRSRRRTPAPVSEPFLSLSTKRLVDAHAQCRRTKRCSEISGSSLNKAPPFSISPIPGKTRSLSKSAASPDPTNNRPAMDQGSVGFQREASQFRHIVAMFEKARSLRQ